MDHALRIRPARRAIPAATFLVSLALGACGGPADDPWPGVPARPAPTPHDTLVRGTFASRAEAVGGCLECHEAEPDELRGSAHAEVAVELPPAEGTGHAGAPVELAGPADCLACHVVPELVDPRGDVTPAALEDAARRVRRPEPENCLTCHQVGAPSPGQGVHLDEHGLGCTDCHRTVGHRMAGPGGDAAAGAVSCTDCHADTPHPDPALDRHGVTVACTTCHIPRARVTASYGWFRAESGTPSGIADPAARIWPLDSAGPVVHEMPPAADAFTCRDCHTRLGLLDWEALGYAGDPSTQGAGPRPAGGG